MGACASTAAVRQVQYHDHLAKNRQKRLSSAGVVSSFSFRSTSSQSSPDNGPTHVSSHDNDESYLSGFAVHRDKPNIAAVDYGPPTTPGQRRNCTVSTTSVTSTSTLSVNTGIDLSHGSPSNAPRSAHAQPPQSMPKSSQQELEQGRLDDAENLLTIRREVVDISALMDDQRPLQSLSESGKSNEETDTDTEGTQQDIPTDGDDDDDNDHCQDEVADATTKATNGVGLVPDVAELPRITDAPNGALAAVSSLDESFQTTSSFSTSSSPPLVFALMTKGPRVVRGAMDNISQLLDKGNTDAVAEAFLDLDRWRALYELMEDGNGFIHHDTNTLATTPKGMMNILNDQIETLVEKTQLADPSEHHRDLEQAMRTECSSPDMQLERMRQLWEKLRQQDPVWTQTLPSDNELHIFDLVGEQASQELTTMIGFNEAAENEFDDLDNEHSDFRFFIDYASKILQLGSDGSAPVPVFDSADWICLDTKCWQVVQGEIQDAIPPQQFEAVRQALFPLN